MSRCVTEEAVGLCHVRTCCPKAGRNHTYYQNVRSSSSHNGCFQKKKGGEEGKKLRRNPICHAKNSGLWRSSPSETHRTADRTERKDPHTKGDFGSELNIEFTLKKHIKGEKIILKMRFETVPVVLAEVFGGLRTSSVCLKWKNGSERKCFAKDFLNLMLQCIDLLLGFNNLLLMKARRGMRAQPKTLLQYANFTILTGRHIVKGHCGEIYCSLSEKKKSKYFYSSTSNSRWTRPERKNG